MPSFTSLWITQYGGVRTGVLCRIAACPFCAYHATQYGRVQFAACAVRVFPGAVRTNEVGAIHVQRPLDLYRVRAHIIRAQHPGRRQLPLHAQRPLLVIRIRQRVGIAQQRRSSGRTGCSSWHARAGCTGCAAAPPPRAETPAAALPRRSSGNHLSRRGRVVEDPRRPRQRVIGLRVIHHLRVIDPKPAANRVVPLPARCRQSPRAARNPCARSVKVCSS